MIYFHTKSHYSIPISKQYGYVYNRGNRIIYPYDMFKTNRGTISRSYSGSRSSTSYELFQYYGRFLGF